MEREKAISFLQFLLNIGLLTSQKKNSIAQRAVGYDLTKALNYALADYLRNLKLTECFEIASNMQRSFIETINKVETPSKPKLRQPIYSKINQESKGSNSNFERFMRVEQQLIERQMSSSSKKSSNLPSPICLENKFEDLKSEDYKAYGLNFSNQEKWHNQYQTPLSSSRYKKSTTGRKLCTVLQQTINPEAIQDSHSLSFQNLKHYQSIPPPSPQSYGKQQRVCCEKKLFEQSKEENLGLSEIYTAMKAMQEIPYCKSTQHLPTCIEAHTTPDKKNSIFDRLYEESKIRDSHLKKKQEIKQQKEQEKFNFKPTLVSKAPRNLALSKSQEKNSSEKKSNSPEHLYRPGINKQQLKEIEKSRADKLAAIEALKKDINRLTLQGQSSHA